MIAAAGRIDLGCPAKFAEGEDHGRIEKPATLEIFQKGCVRVIEIGSHFVLVTFDGAERGRAVDVPGDLVEDRLEHIHGDETNAPLDEPTRQQATLAETRAPIAIA